MIQVDRVQKLHDILSSASVYTTLNYVTNLKLNIRPSNLILEEIAAHAALTAGLINSSYHISKTQAIQNVLDNFTDSMLELDNLDDALTLAQVMIDEAKRNDDNLAGTIVAISCLLGYQFRIS